MPEFLQRKLVVSFIDNSVNYNTIGSKSYNVFFPYYDSLPSVPSNQSGTTTMASNSDLEWHLSELKRHCRFCANVISEGKYSFPCNKNTVLLAKMGIKVDDDTKDVHPPIVCLSCRTKAAQFSDKVNSALKVFKWTAHTGQSCAVCLLFRTQKKGGRPRKKQKNRGRPSSLVSRIMSSAPKSWRGSSPLIVSRFLQTAAIAMQDLQCTLCSCIVDQPLETPCRKLVCASCITTFVSTCDDHASFPCPSCKESHEINDSSFPAASEVVVKVLGQLLVSCDQCSAVVALKNLQQHLSSGCRQTSQTSSPSKITVGQILTRPLNSPPTRAEKEAAARVVKRMLCSGQATRNVVMLPTAGQVEINNKNIIHIHFISVSNIHIHTHK